MGKTRESFMMAANKVFVSTVRLKIIYGKMKPRNCDPTSVHE